MISPMGPRKLCSSAIGGLSPHSDCQGQERGEGGWVLHALVLCSKTGGGKAAGNERSGPPQGTSSFRSTVEVLAGRMLKFYKIA